MAGTSLSISINVLWCGVVVHLKVFFSFRNYADIERSSTFVDDDNDAI